MGEPTPRGDVGLRAVRLELAVAVSLLVSACAGEAGSGIGVATNVQTGHAHGIAGHSDDPRDTMFSALGGGSTQVTTRDRNTVRMIYACPINGAWMEDAPELITPLPAEPSG